MKKIHSLLLILVTSLLVGCGTTSTVPLTGRKQNLLVTDAQVLALSNQQYKEYMSKAIPSTNKQNTEMVKRVGNRLATAVQNYLIQNGRAEEIKNYAWEFNLVQDKNVNAFCMPGGKIVVYEGLLPYTKDEASLAIVLGHEIAHAVARHSAEQMSKRMKAQYGATALSAILWATKFSDSAPIACCANSPATTRAKPTTWDLSLLPWLATTPRWRWPFGNAWLPVVAVNPLSSSPITPLMNIVFWPFRRICQRR